MTQTSQYMSQFFGSLAHVGSLASQHERFLLGPSVVHLHAVPTHAAACLHVVVELLESPLCIVVPPSPPLLLLEQPVTSSAADTKEAKIAC